MKEIEKVKIKLSAVEALRLMKKFYTYKELSRLTGLPIPVLGRYVSGSVLPSFKRAKSILLLFKKQYLQRVLREKSKVDRESGVFDLSRIVSDTLLLKHIAVQAAIDFARSKIDKVLTKETTGIPVAAHIALALGDKPIAIAREKKEMGIEEFIEVRRYSNSGTYDYLYIPKYLLRKGERVLIVDAFIRSGSVVKALYNACKIADASVIGVFSLISVRDVVKKLKARLKCPIKSLLLV